MHVAAGTRAGRLVLVATVLGSSVAFLDGTIVNVALPAIGRGLGAGLGALQWTVDAYLLTLTAFLLPGGALGDRLGRRRIFAAGLVAFGAFSALSGAAPTAATLVLFRALQGLAAALVVPGSLAILRSSFRPEEAGRAVGAWASLSGLATAAGPLAGGWLAGAVSWRAIFLVNVPLAAVAAWATLRFVPESRDPATGRPDLAGATLVALGLGATVRALVAATEGAPPAGTAILLVLGVAALGAFLVLEARRAEPMLPLELFRARAFAGANLVTLAVYFGLGGAAFLLVLQLQAGLGWSPLASGAALLPITVLMVTLSPAAGRVPPRRVPALLVAGPLLAAAGLLLLARIRPGARYAGDVLPGVVTLGAGLAATVTPLTATALAAVPEARAGIASAVNNAAARLSGLLAVAVLPLAGGIGPEDLARGELGTGYGRAMATCAALSAAGALAAYLMCVRGSPPATPGGRVAGPAGRAPARGRRTPPRPRAPAPRRGSRPRG
jgi:EmrB/QacA subfamily drug resistance transporter